MAGDGVSNFLLSAPMTLGIWPLRPAAKSTLHNKNTVYDKYEDDSIYRIYVIYTNQENIILNDPQYNHPRKMRILNKYSI